MQVSTWSASFCLDARHHSARLHTIGIALTLLGDGTLGASLEEPLISEGSHVRFRCSWSPPSQERGRQGGPILHHSIKRTSTSVFLMAGPPLPSHAKATNLARASFHLELKIVLLLHILALSIITVLPRGCEPISPLSIPSCSLGCWSIRVWLRLGAL